MPSLALLALAFAATPAVSPQAQQEARELVHRSQLEYDLDHAEEALRDIERAYFLDPLPGLLFNLGQCHRKLGHWEKAESAFRAYLRYKPDAPNRATVLELIDEMHRARAQEQQRVPAPSPVVVVPELVPSPRAPRPVPRIAAPAPFAPRVAAPPPRSPPAEIPVTWASEPPPAKRSHALAWTFLGVGVAAVAVAVAGAVQVSAYNASSASVTSNEVASPGASLSPGYSDLANQRTQALGWRTAGFVALGVAVAAVPAVLLAW